MNQKPTILAVDDTPESLALLVKILTPEGYRVRPADSGELALAAVAANPPDLILMDVRMKDIDGLEVCRRLKANEETRHIPIILISAFADVKEWVEGLTIGASDYITKPFQAVELLARVKTQIALGRANASIEQQAAELREKNEVLQSEITDRKQSEQELERYRMLAEESRDIMLFVTLDGRIVEANKASMSAYGYSRDVLLALSIFDLRAFDAPQQTAAQMAEADITGILFETTHRRKDGSCFPVEVSSRGADIDGERILLSIVRDITDRKRTEESLARAAERDRHIADVLQRTLIPNRMPAQLWGYEIAARYKPALSEAEVCGDFYDVLDIGHGKLGIAVGDVAGKGLLAAVRVATVRHALRSYAFMGGRPSRVMALLNEVLYRDVETEDHTLTAFFATLDIHTGELRYTNAGHEPPLLMRSDGQTDYLNIGGPMFCGLTSSAYTEATLVLQPGDTLVLVTDGITESRKADQFEWFGPEGIARCLSENAGASAEEIATAILKDASEFAEGVIRDDVVVLAIRKLSDVDQEVA